jgi:putative ATPase
MRPRGSEDLVGQERALTLGSPLQLLLTGTGSVSIILWGPPGTGKTTIATLISAQTGRKFRELSAVSAGVRDVREVIEKAREDSSLYGTETVLFIDEVHRFNKSQQDALLPAVENGWVTLVAATTENPSFSVVSPLLSRSVVVKLEPLDQVSLRTLLIRAMESERGLGASVTANDLALQALIDAGSGDARRALTALEAAANATLARSSREISVEDVENAINVVAINYDKDGDTHYDVISAFIKSIRGSDPDAALHYLARMLHAGEDPRFIARRLMILASEDIGLAASQVLLTAVAAAQSVQLVGMPEAQIILAHATLEAALAPKSNSVVNSIGAAMSDVQQGRVGNVPMHLRDSHYPGASKLGHGANYVYPHDEKSGVAQQSYLPEELEGSSYYRPTHHGAEERLGAVADRLRKLRSGESLD